MNKILVIAKREFSQRVTSRAFLIGAFGTPLILLIIWFFTANIGTGAPRNEMDDPLVGEDQTGRVGYFDLSGIVQSIPEELPEDRYQPFSNQHAAEASLQAGEIEMLYIIPEDYRETGKIQRLSLRLPAAPPETEDFEYILIRNLFPESDLERISRLRQPFNGNDPEFQSLTAETGNEGARDSFNMMPFIVTMFILLPLFTGGGYLLQSLGKEKGEKVMEVLLVSVRPRQLLTGKLLGLGLLVIVQYAIWLVLGGVAFGLLRGSSPGAFSGLSLSGAEIAVILLFALGGFCLYAALMGGIGALAPDLEGGKSWTFVITLPMMIPLYLWAAIAGNPQGTVALVLSMFPYSAPVAMLLRLTTAAVPAWQIALSLVLLILATGATLAVMTRLFRAQTLLSGESISLNRFWEAVTSG